MATTKGARNRQIEESQQKAIVQKVAGMTIESVTADLNKTQLAIQKELASLGTAIGEQFAIYDNLVKAIQIKQDELTNLHQIQVTATTLDDLQAQIEQTREEEKQRIQDFDNQWEQRENDRETAWSRRETEYQYHIDQQHRQQEDQFQQTLTTKRREEATRIEDMEKQWKTREEALKAREQEYTTLKEQVATFPTQMEKAVKDAEGRTRGMVSGQYEHQMQLLKAEHKGQLELANAKTAAMESTITQLRSQIENLEAQLTKAREDAKEVAQAAFNSVSGQAALNAVQQANANRDMPTKQR